MYSFTMIMSSQTLTVWRLGNICFGRLTRFALPSNIMCYNPEAVLILLPELVHDEAHLPEWNTVDRYPTS